MSFDFLGMQKATDVQIGEFMTRDIVSFTDDTDLEEISQVLVRRNIKRVPIMKDDKLVGIVSRRDVLRGLRGRTNSEKDMVK